MGEFLAELYAARSDPRGAEAAAHRARKAARDLADVTYVRAIFVPEDETCLLLYRAPSIETVRAAIELAGLDVERIVEAVTPPSSR